MQAKLNQPSPSPSRPTTPHSNQKPPFPPLSTVLPPILLGTAVFNSKYNCRASAKESIQAVQAALYYGIRGFDTSPFYGPAEDLLGTALTKSAYPRASYFISTKVGRISADEFDFSPEWVRASVARSLQRLNTTYLDLVFCHDIEFVVAGIRDGDGEDQVLAAIQELRKLQAEGVVRYVGISGYTLSVLVRVAERVRRQTGRSLDAIMSYAHFTLQNTRLLSECVPQLRNSLNGNADDDDDDNIPCVLNASLLGMGMLRGGDGVPRGEQGADWHPSPLALRETIRHAADKIAEACQSDGRSEKIETVALRWAVQQWMRRGASAGTLARDALMIGGKEDDQAAAAAREKLGVTVLGVSNMAELHEAVGIVKSVVEEDKVDATNQNVDSGDWPAARIAKSQELAEKVKVWLGDWIDYSWESPWPGFKNVRAVQKT